MSISTIVLSLTSRKDDILLFALRIHARARAWDFSSALVGVPGRKTRAFCDMWRSKLSCDGGSISEVSSLCLEAARREKEYLHTV